MFCGFKNVYNLYNYKNNLKGRREAKGIIEFQGSSIIKFI